MIINHNISALFSDRFTDIQKAGADNAAEKLASGLRINKAADDAAGLAISEKMRTQIRGLQQAERNVQDGISFIQTTEGYLSSMHNILQRVRELAVQGANGTYTSSDREMIQVEVNQLVDEIDRIASQGQFNELKMLTGRYRSATEADAGGEPFYIHMGANMDERQAIHISQMDAKSLGLVIEDTGGPQTVSLKTIEEANRAISTLDQAIQSVSKQRADLGAYQNRLEFASSAIRIGTENLQASESRIRDADMAKWATENATKNILLQGAVSMLAQANVQPQLALQLIQ